MQFVPLFIEGAYLIIPDKIEDDRGFFARTFCQKEFLSHRLEFQTVQCNVSYNKKKGTVRGMHFQAAPHEEIKIVRCLKGSICDSILDLRLDSPTYMQSIFVDLTALNRHSLYIPKGVAHGFQTLEDDTEVFYQMSTYYVPEAARGVRWNDPSFHISWPLPIEAISSKDLGYKDWK